MKIFSISDLHLSLAKEKTMDIFGNNWKNHHLLIKESFLKSVSEEDIVLIPGDISWALALEDAKVDFDFISSLPGKKVYLKGNHDYYWGSLNKLNSWGLKESYFLQNNSFIFGNVGICGTRGWILPDDGGFKEKDKNLLNREAIRLRNSLDSLEKHRVSDIMVMMHYSPFQKDGSKSIFTDIMEEYGVTYCVYGHLHGNFSQMNVFEGLIDGIEYHLVSCDYMDFKVKEILEI